MNPAKWLLILAAAMALRFLYGIAKRAYGRRRDCEFLRACGIQPLWKGHLEGIWKVFSARGRTAEPEEGPQVTMAERR